MTHAFCTDIRRRRALNLMMAGGLIAPITARSAIVEETAPILFAADLSADEQSAPTESPGKGRGDFVLERENLKLSWMITYSGVTSPVTAVRIHGPQRPGTNAGVLLDPGKTGLASPVKGFALLDDGLLEYLLAGRMYVNIFTTKYKDGELRGQIERIRSGPPPKP